MACTRLVILSVLLAAVAAKIVKHSACRDVSEDFCSVSQVRIDPCKNPNRCVLKLGENASLSFDFTPKFSSANLETQVYHEGQSFAGLSSTNGCDFTSCPTASDVSQTFNYHLYIGKKLPAGIYPINWKIWNKDNAQEMCCFVANIKLSK